MGRMLLKEIGPYCYGRGHAFIKGGNILIISIN